ncbi:endonuclease domain-containing protein [Formosa haliotis]|uniref:endonuclease domain-containing protein n=1 Tax=Formosa haliotis TaxID=1555194 RepID=UPI0008271A69|nr:endonuclease domain-containing protein [Formosa haliotis]
MKKRKLMPYDPKLKAYARELRNNSTKAEIYLWLKLKGKQMHGYDFHRQKPIDRFIVDFFCYELMLGIEVDGYTHEFPETQRKDAIKERRLNQLGIQVLRFTDHEVKTQMESVLRAILDYIEDYENENRVGL